MWTTEKDIVKFSAEKIINGKLYSFEAFYNLNLIGKKNPEKPPISGLKNLRSYSLEELSYSLNHETDCGIVNELYVAILNISSVMAIGKSILMPGASKKLFSLCLFDNDTLTSLMPDPDELHGLYRYPFIDKELLPYFSNLAMIRPEISNSLENVLAILSKPDLRINYQ